MVSTRVSAFLTQLRQAQVLTTAQLDQARQLPQAHGEEPRRLAKELVRRGWLTAFQAKLILDGNGASLSFGLYRLLDIIGKGGMGQVFRAHQQSLGRDVALKVINSEHLASPTAVQRFCQEIRAASQLAHPNIVTAFDAGQVGGSYFFAMEYVEGIDLERLVKSSGPLSVALSCEYIRQTALGLQHAHERGLVHRDIKPANLLLSRSAPGKAVGTVKILDMGLARSQTDDPTDGLTRAGTTIGTVDYMAPEQATNSHGVDGRADLYSLGCTFYYLLTGGPPFRGESAMDRVLKHRLEEAPSLAKFRSDVVPAVQAIVRKLMAKRPEDRFQTAAELAAALSTPGRKSAAEPRAALATTWAQGADLVGRLLSRMPRKRGAAVLVCAGLLVLAGLAATIAVLVLPTGSSETAAVSASVSGPASHDPAKEEARRLADKRAADEKAERDRLAREEQARKEREEKERLEKEQERLAREEKIERERKERLAREEKERKEREEKEEAARLALERRNPKLTATPEAVDGAPEKFFGKRLYFDDVRLRANSIDRAKDPKVYTLGLTSKEGHFYSRVVLNSIFFSAPDKLVENLQKDWSLVERHPHVRLYCEIRAFEKKAGAKPLPQAHIFKIEVYNGDGNVVKTWEEPE